MGERSRKWIGIDRTKHIIKYVARTTYKTPLIGDICNAVYIPYSSVRLWNIYVSLSVPLSRPRNGYSRTNVLPKRDSTRYQLCNYQLVLVNRRGSFGARENATREMGWDILCAMYSESYRQLPGCLQSSRGLCTRK